MLVDEAYVDFADESCLELVRELPNLVLCRTLSKGYALAGLRFGYAIAAPEIIAEMMKVKDSYNCDAVAILAATAALDDQDYARQTWQAVRAERTRLESELGRRGFEVTPSQANFVYVRCPGGNARELYLGLKQRGILVRFFDQPGLADRLRITVGTRPAERRPAEGPPELRPEETMKRGGTTKKKAGAGRAPAAAGPELTASPVRAGHHHRERPGQVDERARR